MTASGRLRLTASVCLAVTGLAALALRWIPPELAGARVATALVGLHTFASGVILNVVWLCWICSRER